MIGSEVTAVTSAGYPLRSAESDPTGRADRAARGSLVLARQVVEKIAGQAAAEIASAGGRSGGFLGFGTHTDLSARPKVDVSLFGRTATIEMAVAVAYPTSIRRSTERVRRQVVQRVKELAGVEVTRVDITLTALHRPTSSATTELR